MRSAILLMVGLTALAGVTGCAGVDHHMVPQQSMPFDAQGVANAAQAVKVRNANAEADSNFKGVRYYGTSWYLLVHSDGKGNIVWKVLELPDQTKLMSAHPYNYFARLEVQMTFVNGALDRS